MTVGAPCPDHLVHTKRVPLWVPFDPARDDAGILVERIAAGAVAYREDYRAYVERFGDAATVAADPDPRVVLVQHVGLVACGPNVRAARLSRDLYLRAIEVMAGADALGGFVSLTAEESFAIEYWPLELYKLSLAPPPGELAGQGRDGHRRRRRDRACHRRRAQRRRRLRGRASTSTATARAMPSRRLGDRGLG